MLTFLLEVLIYMKHTSSLQTLSGCPPNLISPLSVNEEEGSPFPRRVQCRQENTETSPNHICNYWQFFNVLNQLLESSFFDCNSRVDYVMLSAVGGMKMPSNTCRKNAQRHTYQIKTDKVFRLLLSNLSHISLRKL